MSARENVYQIIASLPERKAAQVMVFIKSIEDEDPPLTEEEEEGIRQAYSELAAGMGETFEEAFGDFVKA